MGKEHANRGVARNKKPLTNLVYTVELSWGNRHGGPGYDANPKYLKYKFKDLGYLILSWGYEGRDMNYWHGLITPEELKTLIGDEQWRKFCNGKRQFIVQRRIDGKNIPVKKG